MFLSGHPDLFYGVNSRLKVKEHKKECDLWLFPNLS